MLLTVFFTLFVTFANAANQCSAKDVTDVVFILKLLNGGSFCSKYLGYPIPATVTVAKTQTATAISTSTTVVITTLATTETTTVTSTSTANTYTLDSTTTHLAKRAIAIPAGIRQFAETLVSKACSCFVVPSSTLKTVSTPTVVTTTQVVPFQQFTTVYVTATATSIVSTTVDQAVFEQIDAGENCPGFGGNVTPITAVNVADINGCLHSCFTTPGCTLMVTFLSGNSWICELFSGYTDPPNCAGSGAFENYIFEKLPLP